MSTPTTTTPGSLPDYIASAKPNPPTNRAPWFKNTAPDVRGNLPLVRLLGPDLAERPRPRPDSSLRSWASCIGGLICHFLFYLVPGLLGMQTGLPLYVVGTSTFGAMGGLLMPGFLMGLLQFGWLGVNTFFSAEALASGFHAPWLFYPLCVIWAAGAAFVGLKGIQYVAKVATYVPVIPLLVLLSGLVLFGGSAFCYTPSAAAEAQRRLVPRRSWR